VSRFLPVLTATAVLLALLSTALPTAADPLDGTVTGQVVNKTAGGGSPAGVNVLLLAFGRKEQAPVNQVTTQTDADGRYSFSNVDRDANLVYITVARYQNVNYPAEQPFQLSGDTTTQQSDISVFETTSTDDAIQIQRLNLLFLGADQGVAQFMEMGTLVNTGDRTFVTANPQDQTLARGLKFGLPRGAINAQMQSGFNDQDVVADVAGIQVTSPVDPGSHDFALSFQLPYQGSTADLSLQIPYPTGTFTMYLPDQGGAKLGSTDLAAGQPQQLGNQSYMPFSTSNVAKSTVVPIQLTGLGSSGGLGPNQLALVSLGVVLLVLGGGVLIYTMRRPARKTAAEEADAEAIEQERLQLLVRLATLDDRYAAGQITARAYKSERARGKRRLVELTVLQKQTAAPAA
jgi:hypothetical protein